VYGRKTPGIKVPGAGDEQRQASIGARDRQLSLISAVPCMATPGHDVPHSALQILVLCQLLEILSAYRCLRGFNSRNLIFGDEIIGKNPESKRNNPNQNHFEHPLTLLLVVNSSLVLTPTRGILQRRDVMGRPNSEKALFEE